MRRHTLPFVIAVLFVTAATAFAQPDTLWSRTFGGTEFDNGLSVQQTSDGGFIIGGATISFGAGSADVWLIRTDANGDTLWTKTYGGAGSDGCYSVQQTLDTGYIAVGNTSSFGSGSTDIYLIKTHANGDTNWTKTYGASESESGRSVQQTSEGGYIIGGTTRSFGSGFSDFWLLKTDENGDTVWTKTFGGTEYEECLSVEVTFDGGYILTGVTLSFGEGEADVYLVKTDEDGDTLWTRTYGGEYDDAGYSVQQTSDGGYIVVGSTQSFGVGHSDIYLIKTDENGDTVWTKTYGGTGEEIGFSIQKTFDEGFIIAGVTSSFGAGGSDIYIIRTDANGDTLWTKTYGGTEYEEGMAQQTSDGGYIIAGGTTSFGAGGTDVYLIRLTSEQGDIEEEIIKLHPQKFALHQNYPNPFNPVTTISYQLPEVSFVSISVYNVAGQLVETLVNQKVQLGSHKVTWNASNYGSGVYFYKMTAREYSATGECLLLK